MSVVREIRYPRYGFDRFELDPAERRLSSAGRIVALPPRAFDLLHCLVRYAGRLVTKQAILDEVWAGAVVTENALTQSMRQLRAVLGDRCDTPRYIETVPRAGYRFIAPVSFAEPGEAAARRDQSRYLCVRGEAGAGEVTLLDQHRALFDAFFAALSSDARVTVTVVEERQRDD